MKSGVLIVEDMDSDFEMMHRGFRRLQAPPKVRRTKTVKDTTELLKTATPEEIPDLIVLDLKLADGDGSELLMNFKTNPSWKSVPVVVWSAWNDPATGESCRRQGAEACYVKVANAQVARRTIDHIASRWTTISPPY